MADGAGAHSSHYQPSGQIDEPHGAPNNNSVATGDSFSQRVVSTISYDSSLGDEPSRNPSHSRSHNGSFVSVESQTWQPTMGAVLGSGAATAEVTGLYRSPSPPSWTRHQNAGDMADQRVALLQDEQTAGVLATGTRQGQETDDDNHNTTGLHTTAYYQQRDLGQPPAAYHQQSPDMGAAAQDTYSNANNAINANESATATARRPPPAPFNFDDSPAPSSQPAFSPWFMRNQIRAESQTHLLSPYTPSTATPWRSPQMRPSPGYLAAGGGNGGGDGNADCYDNYNQDPYGPAPTVEMTKKKWYAWRRAWVMYLFLLFGMLCAVGHHIFYSTLDGRIADRQLEMLRYGAVLAFATKAGLVSAVIVAFRQRLWLTVRSSMLSVAALDSLFAATDDITALWNVEVYKTASVAMALAVFVWLAPFVIIFTSNTLSVGMYFNTVNGSCPNVRTLNFVKESHENWRDPTIIDDLIGQSVSTWNATAVSDKMTTGDFDYYTAYSPTMELTATMATFTKQTVVRPGIMEDVCGAGWNCSYTVKFVGPGYKCEELAREAGSAIGKFGDHDPPANFGFDFLLPKGNFSFQALTMGGEYYYSQVSPVSPGGMPTNLKKPFPKNLGALRTEPIIWVGYADRVDMAPTNSEMPGWDKAFIPHVFACEHHETAYTVRFSHENGKQTTNITDRQFQSRVIDTKWLQDEVNPSPHESKQALLRNNRTTDNTNDPTVAYPMSNYVFPQQLASYRRVAAYHSIGRLMREFIKGTMNSANVLNPRAEGKAMQTKLLDPRQKWFPYPDLQERVQSLYEDIVLSMLAEPRFVSVVWAANPNVSSGAVSDTSPDHRNSAYPCERSRFENRYRYHRRDLWIVYGIALSLGFAAVIAGTMAVLKNEGVMHDTRFSNIVAATRGPALDKLSWHGRDGVDPTGGTYGGGGNRDLPRDVKHVKVGYGIVPLPGGGGQDEQAGDQRYSSTAYGGGGGEDNTRVTGRMWDAGEVRYGFGLEGDVRQLLRSDVSGGRPRSRTPSANRFSRILQ
ncbi:hypothetical protein MN608_07350 [Microdochium nivale]|nr:hypothetical protein MN608_07350 [Microdochium nivale]